MAELKEEALHLGGIELRVCTLVDRQQYSDDDGEAEKLGISSAQWSLFGVVWESGKVLADHLASQDLQGRHILEVGCGIGIASLVLNRLGADVTAMDYHPEAGKFLSRNVELNGDSPIRFVHGNWTHELPELEQFDLVVGSDLLYEQVHAEQLSEFLNRKVAPKGEVIITDPRRGSRGRFTKMMEKNGFVTHHSSVGDIHLMNFLRE